MSRLKEGQFSTNPIFNSKSFYYSPQNGVKTKAKVLKNQIHFDSNWEFYVYEKLIELTGIPDSVKKNNTVLLLPDTPRNKRITWNIDFSFEDTLYLTIPKVYVEAKGRETNEFKLKYNLLKYLCLPVEVYIVKNHDDLSKACRAIIHNHQIAVSTF